MDIVNHKKIAQEMVKNFYAKKDKMDTWQVADYDKQTSLVMFNSYSLFRVFKDDFLIRENENGVKAVSIKKFFDTDIRDYKKAETIEIKKKYNQDNKKFYTCFDDEIWIDDDMLKYLDAKQQYEYWYKSKNEPIFVVTCKNFKVALICPVNIKN